MSTSARAALGTPAPKPRTSARVALGTHAPKPRTSAEAYAKEQRRQFRQKCDSPSAYERTMSSCQGKKK